MSPAVLSLILDADRRLVAYGLIAVVLVAPIVAVVIVELLTEGRLGGKITFGWAALAAYFLAGNGLRLLIGTSGWCMAAGLAGATILGLVLRRVRRRPRR